MIVTKEILKQGLSRRNTHSSKQMFLLGVTKEQMKIKGWKKRIIGKDIPEKNIKAFLELKNKHIEINKKLKKKKEQIKENEKTLFIKAFLIGKGYETLHGVCLKGGKFEYNLLINAYIANGGLVSDLQGLPYTRKEKKANKSRNKGRQKDFIKKSKNNYAKYLNSDEWRRRRKKHIKLTGGICAVCGTKQNIHAHHSTYDNVFTPEEINDLVSLCSFHHDELHKTHDKSKDLKLHTFEYIERVRSTISIG